MFKFNHFARNCPYTEAGITKSGVFKIFWKNTNRRCPMTIFSNLLILRHITSYCPVSISSVLQMEELIKFHNCGSQHLNCSNLLMQRLQNHLFLPPNLKSHPKTEVFVKENSGIWCKKNAQFYYIFRRFRKTAHVSVRMEQLRSHWADLHGNWYLTLRLPD